MNDELLQIQKKYGLTRMMQVGAPVIEQSRHVMVPTEFGPKDIRNTPRLISGGFLPLADRNDFEAVINGAQIRTNMVRIALENNFDSELARRLQKNADSMKQLG